MRLYVLLILFIVPMIFLSGCNHKPIIIPSTPSTPPPHIYKGELLMEWQDKDSIKSGETAQLKVWAKNTDDRSLIYSVELSAEGTGVVEISLDGQPVLNVNIIYDSVQSTAQTSQKIFAVKGTTETTSQTVKITGKLYAENSLVYTKDINLKISK